MPVPKDLVRLGGLFDAASNQSKPFLTKCSKTKFLSVSDYYRASDQYVELAKEVLTAKHFKKPVLDICEESIPTIKSALESGQFDSSFLSALEALRSTYLDEILKPAFKEYLQEKTENDSVLQSIYLTALKIDGLIVTIQFMNKVQSLE